MNYYKLAKLVKDNLVEDSNRDIIYQELIHENITELIDGSLRDVYILSNNGLSFIPKAIYDSGFNKDKLCPLKQLEVTERILEELK
jgi:hypothetical protein